MILNMDLMKSEDCEIDVILNETRHGKVGGMLNEFTTIMR